MKALTVCQPYADLLLQRHPSGELVKPIENRPKRWSYRGPLAIHAGLSRAWMDEGDDERYPDLVFGAVLGMVNLIDCVKLDDLPARLRDHEHANGPWCLLIDRPLRLSQPIPYRGAQGLWNVPDHVLSWFAEDRERVAEHVLQVYRGTFRHRAPETQEEP